MLPPPASLDDSEMEHAANVAEFLLRAPMGGRIGRSLVRYAMDYADQLEAEIAERRGDQGD